MIKAPVAVVSVSSRSSAGTAKNGRPSRYLMSNWIDSIDGPKMLDVSQSTTPSSAKLEQVGSPRSMAMNSHSVSLSPSSGPLVIGRSSYPKDPYVIPFPATIKPPPGEPSSSISSVTVNVPFVSHSDASTVTIPMGQPTSSQLNCSTSTSEQHGTVRVESSPQISTRIVPSPLGKLPTKSGEIGGKEPRYSPSA